MNTYSNSKKAWRIVVGSLLVMLFLTKGKLEAPPPASIGNKIETKTAAQP